MEEAHDVCSRATRHVAMKIVLDPIDDTFSQGWSILVVGQVHRIADPDAIREVEPKARGLAWAGANVRSGWPSRPDVSPAAVS
ncbi:hypothetical protein [Streptomyces laculatispora]|uniref:hypothetical protein n=1 Tax=Streptomyces laculatispora TaxID=887464 RepID=UPI001A949909|nr:hypothetical protein [Streptomyces laculatispora]MBO0916187.1 hypothetical protein [Streptomyces laculatispora]